MSPKFLITIFLCIIIHNCVFSQGLADYTQSRILILLDESASMIEPWNNSYPKYKAADTLIMKLMDSIYAVDNQVEFSLRVLGHQYPVPDNNCQDTKNEVPFSRANRAQMTFRLSDIHPRGVTPLAYALQEAAENDLTDEIHNAYSIVLITDGGESCGGNICEVMKNLVKRKVYFKPYIVSLQDDAGLKDDYTCMGNYLQVIKPHDVGTAITTIVNAFRPMLNITKKDYYEIKKIAAKQIEIETKDNSIKTNPRIGKKESLPVPDIVKNPEPEVKKDTPKPKTAHSISVASEPERLQPVKIKKIHKAAYADLFVKLQDKKRMQQRELPALPEIKIKIEKPEPVSLRRIAYRSYTDLEFSPKTKIKFKHSFQPEVPELKITVEKPVSLKLRPVAAIPYAELEVTPKTKIKFKHSFQPEVPELKVTVEKPVTVKLRPVAAIPYADLEVTPKTKIKFKHSFQPEVPEISITVEKPVTLKLAHIYAHGYTDLEVTPKTKIKFKHSFQPDAPEMKVAVELPAPAKITHLTAHKYAEFPFTPKTNIKFKSTFHPGLPETKVVMEKPAPVPASRMALQPYADFENSTRTKLKFKTAFHPPLPQFKQDVAEKPASVKLAAINHAAPIEIAVNPNTKIKFKKLKLPDVPQFHYTEEVPKLVLKRIQPVKLRTYLTLWSADKYLTKQKIPNQPILNKLLKPVGQAPAKNVPNNSPIPANEPQIVLSSKTGGFEVQHEDATETSLAVYFTDGKGKFYTSSPLIKIYDPAASNHLIDEFFRTTDRNGNPDLQTNIPPGKYSMVIMRRTKMLLQDIDIIYNKKNKVILKVQPGSLTFEYGGAPNRPVKEFSAQVTERNVPNGKVIIQKCTEELPYGPGNYHVIVNTLPEMVFNVDLDFDEQKPLTIYQPGFVKFSTSLNIKSIKLYVQQDDKFLPFYTLDMSDPAKSHFQLQPGTYQAYYQKGPSNTSASQKVVIFTVMSNEEVEVMMN